MSGASAKIITVNASRGKKTRAQPVAALKQHALSHYVGTFRKLEAEWTGWEPGDPSPDRLDAEVWAITHLVMGVNRGIQSANINLYATATRQRDINPPARTREEVEELINEMRGL